MDQNQYKSIRLKPGKDRSVRNFHPWIFSGAVASDIKALSEGEIVEVYDAENKYLATGHFHKGTIMVRVLTFVRSIIDLDFWKKRFESALQLRKTIGLPNQGKTNAFRLIHAEGDHLPGLVIDVYGQTAVVQAHSQGMQLSLDLITTALLSLPGIENIFNKSADLHGNAVTSNSMLAGTGDDAVVLENNHQFYVNWKEGQKTGFFLDQRDNRELIRKYAQGKSVLNTFCYSGGFSVYALGADASRVVSVDGSQKAIDWTEKNVELNFGSCKRHQSYCTDAFDYLKKEAHHFDLIVLDPPAFAKNINATDKAVIGYRNLNEIAIKSIKPGGIIFTFSCSQAIDKTLFRKTVFTAAAKAGRSVRILHQLEQGPDHPINLFHPEGEYLKGMVLKID